MDTGRETKGKWERDKQREMILSRFLTDYKNDM